MSYRITETTDHKHLGRSIPDEIPSVLLLDGAEIVVQTCQVIGDRLTISNPNYILHAVKE